MHPIREDEDDVLARLEARLEQVSAVITRLKERNAELETQLHDALSARDDARAEAEAARQQAARVVEEAESLRARQKEAATRVKSLLAQMEQMDLLAER
jgi:FtsZ-binding cell division protein ZapB